jgi:hypothetical protein
MEKRLIKCLYNLKRYRSKIRGFARKYVHINDKKAHLLSGYDLKKNIIQKLQGLREIIYILMEKRLIYLVAIIKKKYRPILEGLNVARKLSLFICSQLVDLNFSDVSGNVLLSPA